MKERKTNYVPPKFEGEDKALKLFFGRNMRGMSIVDRGVVVVTFTVDKDGNVRDGRVIRGVSAKVDEEARRLVSILPKWQPATRNGVPVDDLVEVEIPF